MSDIAIRVENPCPERGRRMSKLYRIGVERHDTLADFRLGILDFGRKHLNWR